MKNGKVLKTENNTYFFDPITNGFLQEEVISLAQKTSFNTLNEKNYINSMLEEFKEGNCDNSLYFIFSTSHQCTFRCKYCIYSGGYMYQREHENKYIDAETIEKTLEFFVNFSKKAQEISVCFYDESLVNHQAVKQIIKSIKEKGLTKTKKVNFIVATNGLALQREDIRDFLIENDCIIYVSLDGPQDVHDQWRVTAAGKPSWEKVIRNMEKIKEIAPEFYDKNIIFQAVVVDQDNLIRINEFFNNHPLTREKRIIARKVNKTDMKDSLKEKVPPEKPLMETVAVQYFLSNIAEENFEEIRFLIDFWSYYLKKIHFRGNKDGYLKNRICIPGKRKIFVDVSGKLYNCEKHGCSIGTVEDGVNYEKVTGLVNSFADYFLTECRYCWARDYCEICYDSLLKRDQIDKQRLRSFCMKEKIQWEEYFRLYLSIYEKNPSFFDKMFITSEDINEAKCGY